MLKDHLMQQSYRTTHAMKYGVPLPPSAALATLLVVEGVLELEDAANSVRLPPQSLVKEAQAWAVAASSLDDDETTLEEQS